MVKPTLFAELVELGEPKVRDMLARRKMGAPGNDHRMAVEVWLDGKVRERAEAAADKRHALEEEALSVAKEANDIARSNKEALAKIPNPTASPSAEIPNKKNDWHDKPLGKIWLTVVGGVILVLATYLLKQFLAF